MSPATPNNESDLRRVGREYLSSEIDLTRFRRLIGDAWLGLSNLAPDTDRTAIWRKIVDFAQSLSPAAADGDGPFTEESLRRLVSQALGETLAPVENGPVARARRVQAEIREVLLSEWDPIGVNDIPGASDEYDSYIPEIYRLLARSASDGQLADHLSGIERFRMGLPGPPHRDALLGTVLALKRVEL